MEINELTQLKNELQALLITNNSRYGAYADCVASSEKQNLITNNKMIKDLAKEYHEELDLKVRTEFLIQFKKGDNISVSLIQRKCKVGYNTAVRLVNYLNQNRLIDFRADNAVHIVL